MFGYPLALHDARTASPVPPRAVPASSARRSAQQLEVLADQLNAAVAKFQV